MAKRESKKLAKYEQEELDSYHTNSKSRRIDQNNFIKIKELEFELTEKQKKLIKLIHANRIITVTGAPGTSKTFLACYAAVQAYLSGKCKKIVISKPTEELSGTKSLGALPGTLEEKVGVYAESFFDAFEEMLDGKDFKQLWDDKVIEFKPAQFLRGRTLKDSYIIIDEFQNFDYKALKSIITRLGRNSKLIFCGDTKQNDISKKYVAIDAIKFILEPIPLCVSFEFTKKDIVRDQLLIDIVDRFELYEEQNEENIKTIKGT